MSSYLVFRYIERDDMDFFPGIHHQNIKTLDLSECIPVVTADEIDQELEIQIRQFDGKKKGILLSGGMDSAIVASYIPGSDAYTFRFLNGKMQKEELERAEYYARYYGLKLHYVDINWDTVQKYLEPVMRTKAAPVHSIEPQIMQAAVQAKNDGVEIILIGNGSDYVFGGMDGLLAKDWKFDEFIDRYVYIHQEDVLSEPVSMQYVFERYQLDNDNIDYLSFFNDITITESYSSYMNAFETADMSYYDPYAKLKMGVPLNLERVRNGEPKYLIRELFSLKYPDIPIPDKIPMPRPVDEYFKDWIGPKRTEFKQDINMGKLTGNQKWQIYCLEAFLNQYDS